MEFHGKKVVILGAGIAGLGAGYKLADKGFDIDIFEAEDFVGGLASSFKFKDCIFDYGPHSFHAQTEELLKFFLDLMGDEVVKNTKNVKIRFRKKTFDYPIKPVNILINLDKKLLISCMVSFIRDNFFKKNESNPAERDSLEELYISLYGKKLYSLFFEDYTKKVWGLHPSKISNGFLKHRLPNKTIVKLALESIKNIFIHQDSQLTRDNIVTHHFYPKKGSIRFPEKLAEKIINCDGKIYLNTPVKKLHVENNTVKYITVQNNNKEEKHKCDLCISTIPVTNLIDSIDPAPPERIIEASKKLTFRAILIVCLVVNVDKVIDELFVYYHNQFFNRIGQMNSFSQDTAPPGKSAIAVEITCSVGDEIWNMDEDELVSKILDGLKDEDKDVRNKVEGYLVLRARNGYPVPALGYEEHLFEIFKYINNISNLYVTGRQGLFIYTQMAQSLNMGFETAYNIMDGERKSPIYTTLKHDSLNFV